MPAFGIAHAGSWFSVVLVPLMARFQPGLLLPLSLVLAGCAAIGPKPATEMPPTWAHERSDLKPDPQVVWGRLDNGLRYAILPHAVPAQRASICLLVDVGSYEEHENERGYAHFVEHMVFRGTTAFPGDSAIRTLQRMGVAFGPHVNAFTTKFQTYYDLENLPLEDRAALATGLRILRGFAGDAVFDPAGLDAERGVIFSEKRSHDASVARFWPEPGAVGSEGEPTGSELDALFGKTRIMDRSPIGTEATLNAATAGKLRAFYQRWYRADRMVVAVAGDFRPAEVEQLVRETFGDLPNPSSAPAAPPAAPQPHWHTTPWLDLRQTEGEPSIKVSLCAARPDDRADTAETRRRALARNLALHMIEQRLNRVAEQTAAFTWGETLLSHAVPGQEMAFLRVSSPAAHWAEATVALETETRRICAYGFTPTEFDRAVRAARAGAEDAAFQAAARPSGGVARALAFSVARGVVFTAGEDDRARTDAQLSQLTVVTCNQAIRELFARKLPVMSAAGTFAPDDPAPERVSALLTEAEKKPLAPYVDLVPKTFPYPAGQPAGEITASVRDPVLDADLIEFANGVRLNLKRTTFEPHRVHVAVTFGTGLAGSPKDKPGLGLRAFGWIFSGVGKLTFEEEYAALPELSGWTLNLSVSSTELHYRFTGASVGLTDCVEDMAAHFFHPSVQTAQWSRSMGFVRQVLAPLENAAPGVANTAMMARLTRSGAFTWPSIADVERYTPDEFSRWFLPQLARRPIEIAIVGDFDPAEARELVARTFGMLPPLAPPEISPETRKIADPPPHIDAMTAFVGPTELGAVKLLWNARDAKENADRRAGVILANILADRLRLKIRAELGKTYSPNATFGWNDVLSPSPASLDATIEVAPEDAKTIAAAAREVAEKLGREGATTEEFERARQPLVFSAQANLRDNDWWLDVMETAQAMPAEAREKRAAEAAYRAATLDQVNALAHRVLCADRCNQMIAVPVEFAAKQTARTTIDGFDDHADVAAVRAAFEHALATAPEFADLVSRRGKDAAPLVDSAALLMGAYADRSGERYDRHDFTAAIADDDRVIALQPKSSEGYNNRGAAKEGLKDLAGAIADYSKAIELDPTFRLAFSNRAEAETALGKYDEALADCTAAIKLEPKNATLYRARSEVRRAHGDRAGAAADLVHAQRLAPRAPAP